MDKSRFDSSLGLQSKLFLNLLQTAENGILDLNQASVTLSVQKRPIYDTTNVLEGIGLLTKISINNIQGKGSDSVETMDTHFDLSRDLNDLEYKENVIHELISLSGMFFFFILTLHFHLFTIILTLQRVTFVD